MNNFNKQIKNLTDRWLSKQKISEVLNVDENVINQTLEEIVVKKEKVKKTYTHWNNEMDEQLRDYVKKGYNFPKISKKMGITANGVSKRWSRIKENIVVKTVSEKRNNIGIAKRYTPEEDKQLISLYKEGKTFAEIGKLTGRTTWTVTQRYSKIKPEVKNGIEVLTIENSVPTIISEKDQKIIENVNNVLKEPISINTFPINISVNKGEIIKYLIDNNLIEIKIQ